MPEKPKDNIIVRPPVVVIMGHIDHGKSTLLDYIRKTNAAEQEAGGITQHISAYEVIHKGEHGNEERLTFLDTPGHEAFSLMRSRGAHVADIAILIVSAEDGVKNQTLEALETIKNAKIPFIVAISKIDKTNANVERTKNDLLEHGVYLEGLGGSIPFIPISAKTGEGISELLDLLLLAASIEELTGTLEKLAEGYVIESHVDTKKGITATLLIKDGVLKSGMFIVAGNALAPVRIMENFMGKIIQEGRFSSPIRVIGFNTVPQVGERFQSFATKKEAERSLSVSDESTQPPLDKEGTLEAEVAAEEEGRVTIPIIIKTDVLGTIDAIEHEIKKLDTPRAVVRIIQKGVGGISERDIKHAAGREHAIILGFNVSVDARAKELAERMNIEMQTFSVIYDLTTWLLETVQRRTPKIEVEEMTGQAKVLKVFGKSKNKQVVGGKVTDGTISRGRQVKIIRRETEIGRGKIESLQSQKLAVEQIQKGNEFGCQIESKIEVAPGDMFESFTTVTR